MSNSGVIVVLLVVIVLLLCEPVKDRQRTLQRMLILALVGLAIYYIAPLFIGLTVLSVAKLLHLFKAYEFAIYAGIFLLLDLYVISDLLAGWKKVSNCGNPDERRGYRKSILYSGTSTILVTVALAGFCIGETKSILLACGIAAFIFLVQGLSCIPDRFL